ncbi:B12-binding domain-containing radical SAM protein [Abyssisolibacter fermentans]|uniref:B12-binding domain-containing radical SAM protein n=1 Tax=Abyssisolibacter fermentans TaxID=1766203 RepID=UPI00083409CE|nr:radical SAM protein [Abyssisolibacter fermentans]
MDSLLVKVPYRVSDKPVVSGFDQDTPPLGIYTLKAYLKKYGYDIKACHVINNKDLLDLKETIKLKSPKFIGLSATTYEFIQAINMAKLCKSINPKIPIIIGGPHVSINYEEALKYKEIDIVSRYEGEETLKELLENYSNGEFTNLENIKGIAFRKNDKVVVTPNREYMDLDEIPLIDYSEINRNRYKQQGVLITSRGCVGRCIFCAAASGVFGRFRERSTQNVFQDMYELYHKYGISQINILDNSFTVNKKRTHDVCNLIINNNLPIRWNCETRVEGVDKELLTLMKKAGCYSIQYGVESANDKTLANIRKGTNIKTINSSIELALEVGIEHICCNFIIGLPGDTVQTLEETFEYMRKFKASKRVHLSVSVLTPYPGTYVYNHAEDIGVNILTKDWKRYNGMDVVCETNELSAKIIREIYYKAYNEFYVTSYKEYI